MNGRWSGKSWFISDYSRGQVEKRGAPTAPEKYPETIVEPFDAGWSEYDESIIDVQAL